MADKSAIEWTDATWNPVRAFNKTTGKTGWFCTHASEGCRFCYAEKWNERLGTGLAYKPGHRDDVEIYLDKKMLDAPLAWKTPRRIFTLSMSDLFGEFVEAAWVHEIFDVMIRTPQHTYQVLTKRDERMYDMMHAMWDVPPPNVWLGVSVEDQANYDTRAHTLLHTPAAKRFLSCEPLLGPIELKYGRFDWLIAGGESGPGARPMHPDWARALRDQCDFFGTPFFFKQWGEWEPREQWSGHLGGGRFEPMIAIDKAGNEVPPDVTPQDIGGHRFARVGKKRAGRQLDGREHSEFPS